MLASALAFGFLPALASGHAYIAKPAMRGGAENNVGNEYCPQCLGSTQLPMPTCGKDKFLDVVGPVTELTAGEMFEIVIKVTAHHMGHFVFRLCDQALSSRTGGLRAEEACLNRHVLKRARPEEVFSDCRPNDPRGDCQPYDEVNPGNWYLPPPGPSEFRFHYYMPANVTCRRCTLQFFWMSANSCTPDSNAYNCYFQEMARQGWDADAWCSKTCHYDGACDPSAREGPKDCGEQFKNCADVRVVSGGPSGRPGTPPSPTRRPTAPPTPSPTPTPDPRPSSGRKQLVAFVENWKPCPPVSKIQGYDKVIVSFAVSYTWAPAKNRCSHACAIGTPATCNNQARPDLIRAWREAGTKVILSFGGAGMGGSWQGDVNDCWNYCMGRAESVVDELAAIVSSQGFDGVDIDYEYFHSEDSDRFLKELTTGLRRAMRDEMIISHAPMDGDIVPGRRYFDVLKEVSWSIDYVMPQYYNGPNRPANDLSGALTHMGNLVTLFDGDASKVLFGFCIADCSATGSNVDSAQAVSILQGVAEAFPGYGGAFLWAASKDNGWSTPVKQFLSSTGTAPTAPTMAPTMSPTPMPFRLPSPAPTSWRTPTPSPTTSSGSSACRSSFNGPCRWCLASNGVCYDQPKSWCDQWPAFQWCGASRLVEVHDAKVRKHVFLGTAFLQTMSPVSRSDSDDEL